VAVDREGIAAAVPTGDTRVLDRDPEIMMRVLGDLADKIARQAAAGARRVGVADHFAAVEAYQSVFGAEPHETL